MTNVHAARVAASLKKTLGSDVSVEMEDGRYGEFRVFIDGEEALNAGALAFLGVLPTVRKVREVVEAHRARRSS